MTWETVVETTNLAEFDLLRDARLDIRTLDWAQPANREAARLFHEIERAKEERERLDVELRRLLTAMVDEHTDFRHAILKLEESNAPLARELTRRLKQRSAVHECIAHRLRQASRLEGFTGNFSVGRRAGRDHEAGGKVALPSWAASEGVAMNGYGFDDERFRDDEDVEQQAEDMLDFMVNLDVES